MAQAVNAQTLDYSQPGAGAAAYNYTRDNSAYLLKKLWNDRATVDGGSKGMFDAMVKNSARSLARSPNSQVSRDFKTFLDTGKLPKNPSPGFLKYSVEMLDYGVRTVAHKQQNKSNFLDSTFGKLFVKLAQVAVGFIPGVNVAGAMALGAGIGAGAAAASTRPSMGDIAWGGATGALSGYSGAQLSSGINAAGGVGPYVSGAVDKAGNFIRHPIDGITNAFSGASGAATGASAASALYGPGVATGTGNSALGLTGDALGEIGSSGAGAVAGAAAGRSIIERAGNGLGGAVDWGDIIKGGTDILGTLLNNESNNNSQDAVRLAVAADAQARQEARSDLEKGYGRVEKINAPGVKAYGDALGVLNPLLTTGKVKVGKKTLTADQWMQQVDPGYQFRLGEGERLIASRQASSGDRLSGRARKELMRYGQGFASSEFGNSVRRLGELGQFGDAAVSRVGNSAMGQAGDNAKLTLQGGEVAGNAAMQNATLDNQNRTNWANTGTRIASSIYDRYRNSSSGARYVGA